MNSLCSYTLQAYGGDFRVIDGDRLGIGNNITSKLAIPGHHAHITPNVFKNQGKFLGVTLWQGPYLS